MAGQDFIPGVQRVEFLPGEARRVIGVPMLAYDRPGAPFRFLQARITSLTVGLAAGPFETIVTSQNGELPTTFDVTRPSRYEEATPLVLLTRAGETVSGLFQPLSDGHILVRGEFDAVNGAPRPGFARLTPDGELDETFIPTERTNPDTLRLNWLSGYPLSDGRVLKVVPTAMDPDPFSLQLFQADGSLDPNWLRVGIAGGNILLKPMGRFDEIPGFLRYTGALRSVNSIPVFGDYEASVFHFFLTNAPRTSLQIGADFEGTRRVVYFRRLGPTDQPATVRYTTRDHSAVGGRDYVSQNGTLTFAPRELSKVVYITIPPASGDQFTRDFEIVVAGAEGLEALPAPQRITLWGTRGTYAPLMDRVKRLRDGRVLLGSQGPSEQTKIEFSTDLKTWQPMMNLQGGSFGSSSAIWLDPSATNSMTRFYRAVTK